RHDVGHREALDEVVQLPHGETRRRRGQRLSDVAIAHDADQTAVIDHEEMADARFSHEQPSRPQARLSTHGEWLARHQLADQHESTPFSDRRRTSSLTRERRRPWVSSTTRAPAASIPIARASNANPTPRTLIVRPMRTSRSAQARRISLAPPRSHVRSQASMRLCQLAANRLRSTAWPSTALSDVASSPASPSGAASVSVSTFRLPPTPRILPEAYNLPPIGENHGWRRQPRPPHWTSAMSTVPSAAPSRASVRRRAFVESTSPSR